MIVAAPYNQYYVARRIRFIGGAARQSKLISFPYDSFVRLTGALNLIFELGVSLGELPGHLIDAVRGATIADIMLQKYGLAELELGRGHLPPTSQHFRNFGISVRYISRGASGIFVVVHNVRYLTTAVFADENLILQIQVPVGGLN
jgi:hypothetical protein